MFTQPGSAAGTSDETVEWEQPAHLCGGSSLACRQVRATGHGCVQAGGRARASHLAGQHSTMLFGNNRGGLHCASLCNELRLDLAA